MNYLNEGVSVRAFLAGSMTGFFDMDLITEQVPPTHMGKRSLFKIVKPDGCSRDVLIVQVHTLNVC